MAVKYYGNNLQYVALRKEHRTLYLILNKISNLATLFYAHNYAVFKHSGLHNASRLERENRRVNEHISM